MRKDRNLACPKCEKELKSKSGYTLHIKKCCPEMRFLETRVKMVIEFVAPRNVERLPALGMFRDSFGPYDRKDGGCSQIKSARVISATVTPREANSKEIEKLEKAMKAKDRNESARELKKIVDLAINKDLDASLKWRISANTKGWPNTITIDAYPPQRKGDWSNWSRRTEFLFNLPEGKVKIHNNENNKKKELLVANPDLFEIIQSLITS
jgi:hypothetical protein